MMAIIQTLPLSPFMLLSIRPVRTDSRKDFFLKVIIFMVMECNRRQLSVLYLDYLSFYSPIPRTAPAARMLLLM